MAESPSVRSVTFVFGALRSGTTLFRLMLNAHGGISNPGEVDFLFDFLAPDPTHPTGWRYDRGAMQKHRIFRSRKLNLPADCDGLDLLHDMIAQLCERTDGVLTLNVHRHADRIARVLPQARFIHLLRDPRDVARSSIGMGWSGNSFYGVEHWIATERSWDRAATYIAEDQVMTLRFETLMADLENQLKRASVFLGLKFSASMLDYHKNTTYAPPDPRIAGQWRRNANPYDIALLEGKCGDLIVARGYELNGAPLYPGWLERRMLALKNRVFRWRYNIRRFGWPLFVSAHFTRLFGAKTLNERVQRRMDEKTIESLK